MPSKARLTRERILEAAFAQVRERGEEALSARDLARSLGCSTQPLIYHFGSMEALRRAVYERADTFHSEWLETPCSGNPALSLGLNYVRFAAREKHLFRFLFRSGEFSGRSLAQLIDDPAADGMAALLAASADLTPAQARGVFRILFLLVHGYASMCADNDMSYDEETLARDLETAWRGAITAIKGEEFT